MHNNCLYCGAQFRAKRATRKYCSDNCKQLAYFKRNGMVFGMNGSTSLTDNAKAENLNVNKDCVKPGNVKRENLNVKTDYVKPDSVKKEVSVKTIEPANVKQAQDILRKADNDSPALNEKQMQEIVYRISAILDVKLKNAIADVKKELDVKYRELYDKGNLPDNTQNAKEAIPLCNELPFAGITRYIGGGKITPRTDLSVKPDVKHETKPFADYTQSTIEQNEQYDTVKNSTTQPETLPYMELADDDEGEHEGLEEKEDSELYDSEDETEYEELEDDNELYDNQQEDHADVKCGIQNESNGDSAKDRYISELESKLKALTLKGETELKNETEHAEADSETQAEKAGEAEQERSGEETDQEYEWIQSAFLQEVANEFVASDPGHLYWDDTSPNTEWVNVRLRCIAENILRLSEYESIDRESLLRLTDALNKTVNSDAFSRLTDYPFRSLTMQVAERMNALLSGNKNNQISLRIDLKTKARLVSMRYQMKENVPLIKFDEMTFDEPLSRKASGRSDTNNPESWQQRYKKYVAARVIVPDDDYESNAEDDEESESEENRYDERLRYFERTGTFPKRAA